MSYNVENLFDTDDDAATDDDSFLPEGDHRWTKSRYHRKLQQIARVISSVGGMDYPALVGLVEVENAQCLEDLLRLHGLGQGGYRYHITRGEDPRGINVALLYHPECFAYLSHEQIDLHFPFDSTRHTRPLLYVLGRLPSGDSLHIFVCHLPSRRGGALASQAYRDYAAQCLSERCHQLLSEGGAHTHALIMGDFNGTPEEAPTARILGAKPYRGAQEQLLAASQLVYLQPESGPSQPPGSYCYRGVWSCLDQMLVSASLLAPSSTLTYVPNSSRIYYAPYLGEGGSTGDFPRPRRSYGGTFYKGGYSDHYPIVARLRYQSQLGTSSKS